MRLLFSYVPFQILLGVILGILMPTFSLKIVFMFWALLLFLIAISLLTKSHIIKCYNLFIVLLLLGLLLSWNSKYLNNDLRKINHYTQIKPVKSLLNFTLYKQLKSTSKYYKFYAKINAVNTREINGLILVYLSKDTYSLSALPLGTVITSFDCLSPLNPPSSPYSFNYKSYLNNHGVYACLYVKNLCVEGLENSFWFYVQRFKNTLVAKIMQASLSLKTRTLMCSLLFGAKDNLPENLQKSFINAGVVHVLAISGLHIGVLYLMLTKLFGFFKLLKNGLYVYAFLILGCLILFAVFSGLSSSVVRAVTMFGFISLSKLKRQHGVFLEPIVTSALVLLLYNPNYLFEVGFQLSYLAVIGIVSFHKLIKFIGRQENKILNYFVDVVKVSMCAQLGVLAISVFYFHQFSIQFLWANLFAVSLLPLVLYASVLMSFEIILFPSFNFLEKCFDNLVNLYLLGIEFFGAQDFLILKGVTLSLVGVFLYYIFLFLLWFYFKKKTPQKLFVMLFFILVCQFFYCYNRFMIHYKREMIIYHNLALVVTIKEGDCLKVLSKTKENKIVEDNIIQNYINEINVKTNSVFTFKNKLYCVLKSSFGRHIIKTSKPINLILEDNPKINLERLIVDLNLESVVVTNKNNDVNIIKWKSTCKKFQVPFYDIKHQGFLRFY